MNFYQNLIGAKVQSYRSSGTIVAAWQAKEGVRVMYACGDGQTYLLDLPDMAWTLTLKE